MKNKFSFKNISITMFVLAITLYGLSKIFFMGYLSPSVLKVSGFTITAPDSSYLYVISQRNADDSISNKFIFPFSTYEKELENENVFLSALFVSKEKLLDSLGTASTVSLGIALNYDTNLSRVDTMFSEMEDNNRSGEHKGFLKLIPNNICKLYLINSENEDNFQMIIFYREDKNIYGFVDNNNRDSLVDEAVSLFCSAK